MESTDDQITKLYRQITITYNEDRDRWEFELRGKERFANTLTLAKQAIDKPAPADKKPFKHTEVYYASGYLGGYAPAVVTSLSPSTYAYGRTEAWIKYVYRKENKREKVSLDKLFKRNDHNAKIIAEIDKTAKEMDTLRDKDSKLRTKLEPANIIPEDYD